ncbi:MAG: aminotransferase class III-fold pyridoxal phosphate-dependent enzyme [bacterium]|nr:aminotransferase class III-fold pyridoxal phosphate-dependent enzyme [bacterium]
MVTKRPILEIPGPKAREVIERQKKYTATTTVDSPLVAKRGNGVWLTTVDDQLVLDGTSGVGVSGLGYGNVGLIRAVIDELMNRIPQFIANDFPGETPSLLAEKLSTFVHVIKPSGGVAKTCFANDGTGANETAVKLLLHTQPGKNVFLAFVGAFHGRTGFSLPLMGSKSIHTRDFPKAYTVLHVPFPEQGKSSWYGNRAIEWERCIDAFIEREYFGSVVDPKKIAGIFLEIVQGEGGIRPISPEGLWRIIKLSRKYDIPIVVDEVQTGFGRTGKLFAFERYDFEPHVVTMAKSFTQLVPGGATVFGEQYDFKEEGVHSGTFQGNAMACRAALQVIAAFEDGSLLAHVNEMSGVLKDLADRFASYAERKLHGAVRDVRGLGLMYGIEFGDAKFRDEVLHRSLIRGLNLIGAGHKEKNPTIRLLPPLIIRKAELKEMFEILHEAFDATVDLIR